uniref:Uncharacterized protein n=1 Tax=Panagrolaimus sp. ES5 TaxID=591445 RepID=A0AC34GEC0_9BILA
ENKHLHDREQQISAELEKGCSKVKVLEAEVEKLTQNKNELHELTMSIAEKVRTAENQAEQVLKAHLQAATEHAKQVETLKSQLEDARKLNPELEKLRKECIDLKARLQASTEHAKEVETLKSQLEELKSAPLPQPIVDPVMMQRISELEEQKSIAEKKMMEVNQLVQTLHDQNKQNHYREQQISAELEKDRSRVKVLEAEVEKLTQNKHELNELQSKYDICITTINKMDTLLRKAYAEAIERSKERDELKKTIESLNTTTGTKEVVIENNNSKVKDLEAEVEKLTQKKNELYELTMSLGEKVRTAEN